MLSRIPIPASVQVTRQRTWSAWLILAIPVLFAIGIAIRLWVLPARGLVGDLNQFVEWVHGISVGGLDHAYDQNLSFPPVMAWIWGALAAVEPAFRTVTQSADPAIRALMKIPASLADLAIAAAAIWWYRERPITALFAAGALLVLPATWYVSAWWGQYESIYVLTAVLAVLAARAQRPALVAIFVAVSLMTKPQALPFVVPFAAWFLATQGLRGTIRAAVIGLAVIAILWLPFLAAGGPANYLGNLNTYQNQFYQVLSINAWNPWWLLQEFRAGGQFVTDGNAVAGPITYRYLALVITGLLALVVFVAVYRRPTPERLALGLAAISLVAFVALTTMHERYSYPAFVFLLFGLGTRGVLAAWALFAAAFVANLVVVVPPEGVVFPDKRPIGTLGAVSITVVAIAVVAILVRGTNDRSYV